MKKNENARDKVDEVRKKRILLVVRWPVGGIRTFMRYVYRAFDPNLYQFTILGPENSELNVLSNDLEGLDFDIMRVSEYPSSSEILYAASRLLFFGNYDLVHSHGFTSGICTALPAFLFNIPHILTSHDTLSSAQFSGFSGRIKKKIMGIALSMVSVIHSVSEDAQANLLEFFPALAGKSGKCIMLPNGIDSEHFVKAVPRDLRGELGIGEAVFLIGFLGRFLSLKGFIYLVDAIERLVLSEKLPKKPLVLAFGEGGFVREEKAALVVRGLDEYFLFLPFTPNVAGVIKGLDLLVMPSLSEACGLLAMETLVAGTPLITSDCIGLREVVRDTPAYMVPSRDSKALEEGIRLFMEKDMRQPFVDYAPKAAMRYDVATTAASLQALINKVIK